MSKKIFRTLVNIIWLLSVGTPNLSAQDTSDLLDSNCEKLSYQKSWPNYSKWSKGIFNTTYLLKGTTISCRQSTFESCVVVKKDGSISLTYQDLAYTTGNNKDKPKPSTIQNKVRYEDYKALKAFRYALAAKRIIPRSQSDDRFKVADANDEYGKGVLAKIQNNPTDTIFNWLVIFDAYQYIVDQVNKGVADDIVNQRSFNAGIIKNPKEMSFTERTGCAKKLFNKYLSGHTLTETDLNGCFAYQAYCTENMALYGLARDVKKYQDMNSYCINVLKSDNADKYSDTRKKACKESLKNNSAEIKSSLLDLNDFYGKLEQIAGVQSPATVEYFKKLRDKYQKVANDIAAVLEETNKDLQKEKKSQQNFNKATSMISSCAEFMKGGDEDIVYTNILNNYVQVYPKDSVYKYVGMDPVKSTSEINTEIKKAISSAGTSSELLDPKALSEACTSISDIALQKIKEAKEKNKNALLSNEDEYDHVALFWNHTINKINEICNESGYEAAYDNTNTTEVQLYDQQQDIADNIRSTTLAPISTAVVNSQQYCASPYNDLSEDKLKLAEELFNSLFSPVIQYEKSDKTITYLPNPIPRLVASRHFAQYTGLDDISTFKDACKKAHITNWAGSKQDVKVLKKSLSGLQLMMNEADIIKDMDSAIAQINKDKISTCAYNSNEISIEQVAPDVAISSYPKNIDRMKLLAKYVSITPGLFQEQITNNPSPILCSILSASYKNEKFNKAIKPILGAANIALLIGSFIPSPIMIPCRAGLIVVGVADGAVSVSNIFDQLSMIDFTNNAVNAGLINYQTGDMISDQANQSIFWDYVSIAGDALIIYQGVKGFSIPVKQSVDKTVSTVAKEIHVDPLRGFNSGQTATNIPGLVQVKAPIFSIPAGFKNALAKFYGSIAIYLSIGVGDFVTAIPKVIATTTESVIKTVPNVIDEATTFVIKNGAKTSMADAGAFLEKLGMTADSIPSYTNILSNTSRTISNTSNSIINGTFLSQIAPVTLASGTGGVIGYKIITAIDGASYVNTFLRKEDGTIVRYSEISADQNKNIPNKEGGDGRTGNGTPVDTETQKIIDDAISDYNKYCKEFI